MIIKNNEKKYERGEYLSTHFHQIIRLILILKSWILLYLWPRIVHSNIYIKLILIISHKNILIKIWILKRTKIKIKTFIRQQWFSGRVVPCRRYGPRLFPGSCIIVLFLCSLKEEVVGVSREKDGNSFWPFLLHTHHLVDL